MVFIKLFQHEPLINQESNDVVLNEKKNNNKLHKIYFIFYIKVFVGSSHIIINLQVALTCLYQT